MEILTTREWATVIWGLLFLIYMMVHKNIRKSFWNVIVIFCGPKLRILWGIIMLYVFGITMIFYQLPIWDNIYIKDIVIWFLTSGLIYCMNAVSSEADEKYIQKVLKDNLKLTLILEFFISTFTFNIWIELVIIPIITIISVMNVIVEKKEEYKNVYKLLDILLALVGFWILYETVKIGINEYRELNVINTLVSFMIPIVYLVLIIPLEYLLELYSKYELLFLLAVFRSCRISVRRVLLFQNEYMFKMYVKMQDTEFKKLIQEFRMACK